MSTETIVKLRDDLDGSEATLTVSFALEGKTYEIDLNDQHADELRLALQPYISEARRTTGMVTNGRRRASALVGRVQPSTELGYNATTIREWAQANGIAVNDRGRVPDDVVDKYHAAQAKPARKAPAKKAAVKV